MFLAKILHWKKTSAPRGRKLLVRSFDTCVSAVETNCKSFREKNIYRKQDSICHKLSAKETKKLFCAEKMAFRKTFWQNFKLNRKEQLNVTRETPS